MRSNEGLSRVLTGVFIPLCVWGLLASLLMYLIDVRAVFIGGGDLKLRQATLSFALGVILIQQLRRSQGPTAAGVYGWVLGIAMGLFAAYHAFTFRVPLHPFIVFIVNLVLFGILWWVGHRIAAACSIDDSDAVARSAESGIFTDTRPSGVPPAPFDRGDEKDTQDEPAETEVDKKLAERLPGRHPGRVIIYFSLFAVPVFGLGVYLFGAEQSGARVRLGAFLFIYLWCALALLSMSSLGQLRAYFAGRGMALPEGLALTWLGLGVALVTVVLVMGFLLPQPPSTPGLYVREQIKSVYRGLESKHGMRDAGLAPDPDGQKPQRRTKFDRDDYAQWEKERYENIDAMEDEYLSEITRNTGVEPEFRRQMEVRTIVNESWRKLITWFMKFIIVIAALGGIFVALMAIYMFAQRIGEGFANLRLRAGDRETRHARKRKKPPKRAAAALARFGRFTNPFDGAYGPRDGDALVRYLWEATVAFCADAGAACPPDQTPREFVDSAPEPLVGFEPQARFISDMISYSEFSGQSVSEERFPELQRFWNELKRHAASQPA